MAFLSPAIVASMTRMVGHRVGSFELVRLLGAGAAGVVYVATDDVLRREVALKLLPRSDDSDDDLHQAMFLREARAAARLVHPNVVQIYQVGETEQFRYIAMEYVVGMNALRLAKTQGGRLSEDLCLKLMRDAASGLEMAASMGICHQDIKPSNMLVAETGVLKIADFGLASQVSGNQSIGVSSTEHIQGTPYYMSPEQWQGKYITPAVDVYSLGCTFYRLITGGPPYGRIDFMACLRAHTTFPVVDPAQVMPGITPLFGNLLMRCMAKAAHERPGPGEIVQTIDHIVRRLDLSISSVPRAALGDLLQRAATEPDTMVRRARGHAGHSQQRGGDSSLGGDAFTPGAVGQRSIHTGELGPQTYPDLYQMRGYPFSDNRQPEFFWAEGPFGWGLRTLASQLTSGAPLTMLVGPSGSGRTFLCEMLTATTPDLPTFRVEPQLLFGERMLIHLCRQHGVEPNSSASSRFLAQVFISGVLPGDRPNARAVVVIDTVDPDDLELLQEISGLVNMSAAPRLSVLLVGEEDLWQRLAAHGTAQGLYAGAPPVSLRPLTLDEMLAYVAFRCQAVGGTGRPLELDKSISQLLHARSGGSPKLINIYCHNALTIAALRGEPRASFDSFRLGMKRKIYLTPDTARDLL